MSRVRRSHFLTPYERALFRIVALTSFIVGVAIGILIAILVWTL